MAAARVNREGPIHRALIRYLTLALPGAVIHHAANERDMSGSDVARDIARAKGMGMRPGWPDIEVFWRGRVLLIEVKAGKGTLSPAQAACHADLRAQGFDVVVCRSVDDATAAVATLRGVAA